MVGARLSITVKPQPDPSVGAAEHRRHLNRQLRAAFLAGAEEDAQRRLGRGLSAEELQKVLRQYPGDLPTG